MIGDSKQIESRKERLAPKHLFTLSDYFQKQQNPARARQQSYSKHDEHGEVQLYRFFYLSAVIHIRAPQLSTKARFIILCTDLCTILWITLRKREIRLK